MDVVVHPGYPTNGWIYLSYSEAAKLDGKEVGMTVVARGRLKDNQWVDEQTLFRAPPETYLPTAHHYGSRLVLDGKGYLYFTIGERERGYMEMAQLVTKPNGKVHRIFEDGRIPADNPSSASPTPSRASGVTAIGIPKGSCKILPPAKSGKPNTARAAATS